MHALDKQQLNRAESGAHVQLARALCVPGPLLVEVTSSTCRALEFEFGIGIGPAAGQLIAPHVSATSLRKARSRNLLGALRPLLQLIEQPLLFTHQRNQKMPRAHGAESTAPRQHHSIFLSGGSWGQTPDEEREFVARLRNAVTGMGMGLWFDGERLDGGNAIPDLTGPWGPSSG